MNFFSMLKNSALLIRLLAVWLLAFPCVSWGKSAAEPQHPLKVYYLEFPPYYFTNSSFEPDGFLFGKTEVLLRQAGIEAEFESMSARRILQAMRSPEPIVSIGWFKTPEREAFARFSKPIYRNKPLQIVFLAENRLSFENVDSFDQLLSDNRLSLGLPQGYSFGAGVDGMIQARKPHCLVSAGGLPQLIRLLAIGKVSYILVAPEELDSLIEKNRFSRDQFMSKALNDMPPGNVRYLMFNRAVPDAVIRKINDVIETLQ